MNTPTNHWDNIYSTKDPQKVSWFQEKPEISLELVIKAIKNKEKNNLAIIDVGAGTSSLGHYLLEEGVQNITLLDISSTAIELAKANEPRNKEIKWIIGDVTEYPFQEKSFDVWHDRAVFHFLVNEDDRKKYVTNAALSLKDNGILIIGTFEISGPKQCSNLNVQRYSEESLRKEIESNGPFIFHESVLHLHETPFGTSQQFIFATFFRKPR